MKGEATWGHPLKNTSQQFQKAVGDQIIFGGPIYTMGEGAGAVECLLVRDGLIIGAGAKKQLTAQAAQGAIEIDLKGATILPGLIDTHPHLLHFSSMHDPLVDILDARDHDDIVARIRARAAVTPPGEWIMTTPVGDLDSHYSAERSFLDLTEGKLPDRHVLDQASHEHPIMIQAWAPRIPNAISFNTLALNTLNVNSNTPDRVDNVWIEKDPSGAPTGVLSGSVTNYYSGDSYSDSLWRQIPWLQSSAYVPATIKGMSRYNAQGVTAVFEGHFMDAPLVEIYRLLRRDNLLRVRVMLAQEAESYGMPWSKARKSEDFMRRLQMAADSVDLTDEYLRFCGVSFMRDGTCFPGFLKMRKPYSGPYGEMTDGHDYISKERCACVMKFCADHKMRLATVSMGSQAHEDNLQQVEELDRKLGAGTIASLHWILVHAFFVEEQQAKRYADLGFDVTTTLSFVWGKGDLFLERMNPEVLKDLIPLKRLFDSGMHVAGGSDWGPKNAFKQIELALTHEFAKSKRNNLGQAQQISREQAVAMWTREAAAVLRWDEIGTLEPGKNADFIVIDRDPFTCDVRSIGLTKVHRTVLAGSVVHDDGTLGAIHA
jgi:predicted amidohydrolase YtcJ